MIVGKYEHDTFTGMEFFIFPGMRVVVNRVLRSYFIEFGKYKFDNSIDINTVYLNQDLHDGMVVGEEDTDDDFQLWLRYNLPQYADPLTRKELASQVYVPY